MKWNRLQYAGLLVLAFFASACTEDVGVCDDKLEGRDTVVVNNVVIYGGQAIMNKACSTGCHSSSATGTDRHGVPAGLDFDLLPVDEAEAAGTKKIGDTTIVKLKSAQIAGLRARQRKIVEQRSLIWQQVQDGLMPPSGMFESVMSTIFASSKAMPCKGGKPYSKMGVSQTREVFRNWLACGAPLVETNGAKVMQSSALGAVGYQYPACVIAPDVAVTLESLFKSTFSDCGGCHNNDLTGPPAFGSVAILAKSLRTKSVCGGKPFVTPGKPDKSYLLDLLRGPNAACNHERMPAGGLDPLSDRAIAEVSAWIAAGAPTTAADVTTQPADSDDQSGSEDDQSTDTDMGDPPSTDMADDQSTGTSDAEQGAGKDAGKDAGRDAGKDAGKDAGRDAGR